MSESFVAQLVTNLQAVSPSPTFPHVSKMMPFCRRGIIASGITKNCWFVGESMYWRNPASSISLLNLIALAIAPRQMSV